MNKYNVLLVFMGFYLLSAMVTQELNGVELLNLPRNFPKPVIPETNKLTNEKIELGRWLFYDKKLSANGQMACATCHDQKLAFTDGYRLSKAMHGNLLKRNSMSLVNLAYNTDFTWLNPNLSSLEEQMLIPLFGTQPPEMGLTGNEQAVLNIFKNDNDYQKKFKAAFPENSDPFTTNNIVQSIACFLRTIVSYQNGYDKYVYNHDSSAMSDAAFRGMKLFFSQELKCGKCHGSTNMDKPSMDNIDKSIYHNNGLYSLNRKGDFPLYDQGLIEFTHKKNDMGKFRVPTLRNIALTAPYMHDGSIETLNDVIDHYARGGRLLEQGDNTGDGSKNPYKSKLVSGFNITPQERKDLLSFLYVLTDSSLVLNPQYSDPFTQKNEKNNY
jgi:cytochrome c peroxidase